MTPDISKLNLDTKATLQQQKEDEARTTTRMTRSSKKAPTQAPLAAPQPTRVNSATGMWNPDVGIRFGNENAPGNDGENKTKGPGSKGWNANQPIQFGK